MSLEQFVAGILNVNPNLIESLDQIQQSDGSIVIKLKLCVKGIFCPYCKRVSFAHIVKASLNLTALPRKLLHTPY